MATGHTEAVLILLDVFEALKMLEATMLGDRAGYQTSIHVFPPKCVCCNEYKKLSSMKSRHQMSGQILYLVYLFFVEIIHNLN